MIQEIVKDANPQALREAQVPQNQKLIKNRLLQDLRATHQNLNQIEFYLE